MSVVIVDEAHERNLTTDIVLGILKKRLQRQRGSPMSLRVVVTSATLDPAKFIKFFELPQNYQPLKIDGRVFPVR